MVREGHAWPCGLAITLWAADRHLRFLGSRGATIRVVLKENTESQEQKGWLGGQCRGLSEEPGCSDGEQSKDRTELSVGVRSKEDLSGWAGALCLEGRREAALEHEGCSLRSHPKPRGDVISGKASIQFQGWAGHSTLSSPNPRAK